MADQDESTGEEQEIDREVPGAPELPQRKSPKPSGNDQDTGTGETTYGEQDETTESDTEKIVESEQTDEAVEDIVQKESDELLAAQDSAARPAGDKPKKRHWWARSWFIWTLVFVALGGGLAAALVPASRYFVLNTAGVRVKASVHVADSTTGQPLKNVTVKIGPATADTDAQGNATLEQLKLGPQELSIERVAFAKLERQVTLGWGSNPLGTFKLSPSGAQYTFYVRDFLSKKPIEGAQIGSGRLTAVSDSEGKAVLTIQNTDRDNVPITVSASGYRSDDTELAIDTDKDVELLLVPSNKVVFVARSEGIYNVYSMYADGSERKVLLAGTGREDSDISLSVSPDGQTAALVSTRENIQNEDGSLLQSLTLINTNSGNSKTLERAMDIRLIDWVGQRLVYQKTMPGVGMSDAQRQRLMSYDAADEKPVRLASAATLESVASAQGQLYYSAADGTLNKVSIAGDAKEETVLDKAVTAAYRTDYDTLMLRAQDGWYRLALSSGSVTETEAPSSPGNRIYVADSSGSRNLWVDGAALNLYDVAGNEDKQLITNSGLSYPVRWLNPTTVVYRAGSTEYALSIDGGDPRKLTQTTDTAGILQAY